MRKFGIEVTKGNTETLIKFFTNREDAMIFGEEYFMELPKGEGVVTCFEAELDDNDQKVGTCEKIYHVWY